jgi:hypothetical protein
MVVYSVARNPGVPGGLLVRYGLIRAHELMVALWKEMP